MNEEYIKPLAVGTRLIGSDNKRYRITKVLGQGTFGITYQATTTGEISGQLGRVQGTTMVAIKEFFMRDINDRNGTNVVGITRGGMCDKYRRWFAKEARNLSHLDHRHIVHVTDSFEYNNTSYFVMEYCDAGSLDDYIIRKGQLSESEALYFFHQIADALSYMHAHSMLHLDLKPANVVLRYNDDDDSDKPDAVLVDFGLSKQYDANGNPESSTSIGLGTPGYAPMEQPHYQAPEPDSLTGKKDIPVTLDVYALGATLFKMLTGVSPVDAITLYNNGFPAHQLQAHNVSPSLIRCIAKAMSPAVRDRYKSVAEFAQAVGGATHFDDSRQSDETHFEESDTRYDQPDDEEVIEAIEVEDPTPTPEPKPRKNLTWLWVTLVGIAGILLTIVGTNSYQAHQATHGRIYGHEWVDLGLPSGLKWATCNVGADKPEEYGNYYAWGETETKSEYTKENCATWRKELGDISGDSLYDAARRNWGGSWRMPTRAECQELVNNCTWTWTTQGGHKGYKGTSKKNGNSIFLPAAGWYNGSWLDYQGEYGRCWSSTPGESDTEGAYNFAFDSFRHCHYMGWYFRSFGLAVRPVCD
ncbi:MAG: protein kinase [Bacteroidaceae bacterium]|nr:protein kinase [Bacteroidaceae bacterium]